MAAVETLGLVDMCCAMPEDTPPHRLFVTHIRDTLHRHCRRFEDADLADEIEESYLPIFDALSHVTEACYLAVDWKLRLTHAQTILRKIKHESPW